MAASLVATAGIMDAAGGIASGLAVTTGLATASGAACATVIGRVGAAGATGAACATAIGATGAGIFVRATWNRPDNSAETSATLRGRPSLLKKTERLARMFQDRVAAAIDSNVNADDQDGKIRRRILQQIGTPRAGDELAALKAALKGRDVLASLSARLPLQIGNLANAQLDECRNLIESAAARDGELFLYALLTVMNRMTAPWQLIRLGVKAAGSDTAARVADTHYGVAVNIVMAELERMVAELREDLRSGQGVAVGALLKTIHDSARGLRTELSLPVDSTWGRALAAQRTHISDILRVEIESMPGRVRHLLRQRQAKEIRPYSVLDPNEVAEVEALVEFVGICRYFAGELAINEITQRALSELRHYLDNGTRALLEGLRHAGDADRSFRQSQVDAAVRFCAKVFGREYAALLGKAAEVAVTGDSKAARA